MTNLNLVMSKDKNGEITVFLGDDCDNYKCRGTSSEEVMAQLMPYIKDYLENLEED